MSELAATAQAQREQQRTNQRAIIEAEMARSATASTPAAKGRLAELRASLAAMGQNELLRQITTEAQAAQESAARTGGTGAAPGGMMSWQPTNTTTIGTTGKISIARRVGGA